MQTFQLQIVTVTKELFNGEAVELHCAGLDGQLTILAHHEPFVTKLKKGVVRVKSESEENEQKFEVTDGILEVAYNRAVVLCSSNE